MSTQVSRAISSQGTRLFMQQLSAAAAVAKEITAITQANPAKVTSAAHGFVAGQVVALDEIEGMTELNGTFGIVGSPTANDFVLYGVDSTGFEAFTGGGTASAIVMLETVEHKSYSGFDGQASELDKTTMVSTAKEKLLGLQDFGGMSVEMQRVDDEPFQIEANKAKADGEPRWFRLVKKNGFVKVWQGLVRSFSDVGGVDAVNTASLAVTIDGEVVDVK